MIGTVSMTQIAESLRFFPNFFTPPKKSTDHTPGGRAIFEPTEKVINVTESGGVFQPNMCRCWPFEAVAHAFWWNFTKSHSSKASLKMAISTNKANKKKQTNQAWGFSELRRPEPMVEGWVWSCFGKPRGFFWGPEKMTPGWGLKKTKKSDP